MDQEDTMDFKALRAKFQEEELLLRLPGAKPVLPGKPPIIPPPQSPPHYLPAGARPSILTSINQSLADGGRVVGAPKVVFKDDKKDGWKPLITPKPKEKSDAKPRAGKDKDSKSSKGSREKLDGEDQDPFKGKTAKDKKGLLHFMTKETPELVPATPPPKSTLKKMVFPGFKKSSKRGSMDMNPILDTPSPDIRSGLPPLIPTGSAPSVEAPARALTPGAPFVPAIPDYNAMAALMPPTFIPVPPPGNPAQPPPTDDAPVQPAAPCQEADPPSEVAATAPTPAVPASSRPATPATPATVATPSPVRPSTPSSPALGAAAGHSPVPSGTPPPPPRPGRAVAAVAVEEQVDHHHAETPPPTAWEAAVGGVDTASVVSDTVSVASASSSPKAERPASALSSALERAAEKTTGKRTNPADQRILKALEKARRKTASPVTPYLMTPTPGEFDLPPMDYEGAMNPEVNGVENSLPEESPDMPELMVVPPPPPRRSLPDPQVLGPPPQKPARPPGVNLTPYLPPPLEVKETPGLPEIWDEGDASEGLQEFDDAQSPERHSPQPSEFPWPTEDYGAPDVGSPPEAHGAPGPEVGAPGPEVGAPGPEVGAPAFREIPEATRSQDAFDLSAGGGQDGRPTSTLQLNTNPHFGNVYEDVNVSATKKKVKVEGLKKRKGPPKNPYDDAPQPTSEEKSKIGRISNFRSERKATLEGPDEKELKKKEKQRLEKEKKEQKEQREREKKEQKEKEKRDNDMKKKFNITGQEEAMYQAVVSVTTKGNKNDLPVTSGENVSIIRTTKCPKGKWLARNNTNTYGYISVDHVKLDIKEMMEMGRRTTTSNPISGDNVLGGEATSMTGRHSNHYPPSTGSFTDDSDSEWTGDEEDAITPTDSVEPFTPQGHVRAQSVPDSGNTELSAVHQHSHSDIITDHPMQARHEALHKLATFFHSPKPVVDEPTTSTAQEETSHTSVDEETVSSVSTHTHLHTHKHAGHVVEPVDRPETGDIPNGDISDMLILPPPELYADAEPELSP